MIAETSAFTGGGTMGVLMRAYDWSRTSLGPQEHWSQSLLALVRVMLNSRQPMFICWGVDRTLVYNDTYAPMLGERHPAALGRPFFETWPEVQDEVGALMDRVFAGDPVHMDDLQLTLHRSGYPEETHFAFSYTPVPGDDGVIVGLFCACTETTNRVTAERRQVAEAQRERDRLFEMSRDLFGVATFDGYLTSINPAWSRQLGRPDA
ncbi:PAS domain-containing protein, partial [Methylobacterium soli]